MRSRPHALPRALARAALGAALGVGPVGAASAGGLAGAASAGGLAGDDPDTGWTYNCRGLTCLVAACTSGVGLGNVHYYRFGVNVEPSDRDGDDRRITQFVVAEMAGWHRDDRQPFSELRLSVGRGADDYAYSRRLRPAELGRVIDLPSPVYIKPGYRMYVGIHVNTHLPGGADAGHGQAIGDCAPVIV